MGKTIGHIVVKNKKDIMPEAQYYASVNVDRRENPFGDYHGNMHILEDHEIFKDYESAQEYVDDRALKGFYDDYAVRFYDTDAVKKTKKIESIETRIKINQGKEQEYEKEHSVKTQKSAKIGCKNCGSTITKSYLRSERCPVCSHDLRADYIIERLKKFRSDEQKLLKEIREERQRLIGKAPVKWLVRVEVHS